MASAYVLQSLSNENYLTDKEPFRQFEFIRQLSADPANTIFGLVRDKDAVQAKVAAEIGRSNITILEADTTDPNALERAAHAVLEQTDGRLDYVIANAALQAKTALVGFDVL